MFASFNFADFFSAFLILFAIIDIPGAIPVIINIKKKGKTIKAAKAAISALIIFFLFFYIGEAFLKLFGVDISSFAVAGSIIIFVVGLEMILDIEIFKTREDTPKDATIVPIVFPLIAGSGSLTTLLSIRAQYTPINILPAVVLNIVVVYFVLKMAKVIERKLGVGMIYMLQKFFGIILLAISVKLFTVNIASMINSMNM